MVLGHWGILLYPISMEKVLVTGANGFVGQHVVAELLAHDISVVALGGPIGSSEQPHDNVEYLSVDLTAPEAVNKIDFTRISGVIHLAGLAAVGPSFDKPLEYITANSGMEINLFEAALAQNAHPRALIISSGSLYDAKADLPLTETSPVSPSSPYAVSKVTQEQMAWYYGGRGFECVVARPFNHIGPGQNQGFIVPDLTKQVVDIERGAAAEVRVGNLDAERDYTDVRDIARAYRLLLEKGAPGETYNICSGRALSGHVVLEHILKASGGSPPITTDPAKMRPADNPVIYGSHDKLTLATGWEPTISIEDTMRDVVADWRSRA